MLLGEELEQNIVDAWLRVRKHLLSNPAELRRRLARRRTKSLTRPPRAWCIAIRASDRRINPAHWIIVPEHAMDLDHPLHPYEPIEHEVIIQTHAIRRYCHPVWFSREEAVQVSKMLGVSSVRHARLRGVFRATFIRGLGGKPGKPVPLLSNGGQLLDPSFRNFFAAPHPIWGTAWEFLNRLFPGDFEQTVLRRPHFSRINKVSHHPDDPPKLLGYRWICPACKKPARTIYYPLQVRSLFDSCFTDPVIALKLTDADLPQPPPPSFACFKCHDIHFFSSIHNDAWNHYISHLTGGLLFGHEVQKPASFIPQRKRTRVRQLNRAAPLQRKVLTRLANGWSNFQIARDLGITHHAVEHHVRRICKQENVKGRHALAKKLNFAHSPPLNYLDRARLRRQRIQELLLRGLTRKQIIAASGLDLPTVTYDICRIYTLHGVSGHKTKCRHALAQKLAVQLPPTPIDELRQKIRALRETGLSHRKIAKHLALAPSTIIHHLKHLVPPPAPAPTQTPPIASLQLPSP